MPANASTPKKSLPPAKKRRHVAAAPVTVPDHRAVEARRLDLQASINLQAGYHATAEMLSWAAHRLRERAP